MPSIDTRAKIINVHDAVLLPSKTAVLATFDVLTASLIRQLSDLAADSGLLLAVVTKEEGSLLPLGARAELAASLAVIELVVMVPQPLDGLFSHFVDTREADRRRSAELIALIKCRYRAALHA